MDPRLLQMVATVRRAKLAGTRRDLAEQSRRVAELVERIDTIDADRSRILIHGQQSIRNARDDLFQGSFPVSALQGLRGTAQQVFDRVSQLTRLLDDAGDELRAAELRRSEMAQALLRLQRKCDRLEEIGTSAAHKLFVSKAERAAEQDVRPGSAEVKS